MVEKFITQSRNVVDLARYRQGRKSGDAIGLTSVACRHCGAALLEGESDDDCSSAFNFAAPGPRRAPRKFYAE
jgi:hypothetical protein